MGSNADRRPPEPGGRSLKWALPTIAAAAAAAIVGGGAWTVRALQDKFPAAEPQRASELPAEPTARSGTARPEAFGLPSYPGGFAFRSMEAGTRRGSASFEIGRGTSQEIVRYYVEKLGAAGWQFQFQAPCSLQPGNTATSPKLSGSQVRWFDRTGRKQLTLLALNDPQKGRAAQVALSWAPVPVHAPKVRPGPP